MLGTPTSIIRFAIVVGVASTLAGTSSSQVNIYNSNGFDSGYTANTSLVGQQGFTTINPTFGSANGVIVQNTTALSNPNAVRITGSGIIDTGTSTGGGNFWYKTFDHATNQDFRPVATGNPFVRVAFNAMTPQGNLIGDIPYAGVYLEGFNSAGFQQAITPIMVNQLGGISVFSTSNSSSAVFNTADNVIPRTQWKNITVELNFNSQSFKVFVDGSATPIQFVSQGALGSGPNMTAVTEVPFRNFNLGLTTTTISEIGLIAFSPRLTGGDYIPATNNVFIDDFNIVMQTTPVPEPGTILAVAAIGAFGIRTWRRRRAA